LVNPGQKHAGEILKQLGTISDITLSVACGRDEKLRKSLQTIAKTFSRPLCIEGWLEDLPEQLASHHLIIAKAGGATVQECLAAGTPLVMSQIIPGQEEGNAELLISTHCGITATSPQAITTAIRDAFSHGAIIWKNWETNALKTGKPNAATQGAHIVLQQALLQDHKR
jgi:processive 1,2-diacylglycerol beta-glucosyltransferase